MANSNGTTVYIIKSPNKEEKRVPEDIIAKKIFLMDIRKPPLAFTELGVAMLSSVPLPPIKLHSQGRYCETNSPDSGVFVTLMLV